MHPSHRILFNTIVVYIKTIVTISVGLFTTRYVLEALGLDDFGIFGLVGSVIGVLGFLNGSLAGATQRFLSYYRKLDNLNSVFTTSFVLHFLIGIVVVIILEIGGFLFLDALNILPERMAMAHFVFHCVVVITFFSITSTPYEALINANEDMSFMAVISITEVLAKLVIVLLLFATPYDRLGTYAIAMMILAIIMRITQFIFCKIRYQNVIFSIKLIDRNLMHKMFAFSGWNFFESICTISKTQGLPIIINLFFGTAMNAVFSLASQVTTQISNFSVTLAQASAPQIISGIAENNLERSKMLAISSCKFQLFLISLLGIPLIFNIDYVLLIWLKQVPEYLSGFCCLALISEMIFNFSRSLHLLIAGKGYIRGYKISSGINSLIVLLIAYILLKMNFSPYSIYITFLSFSILSNILHIYFAHRHAELSVPYFLKEMSKISAVVLFAFLCISVFFILNSQFSVFNSSLAILIISTILSSSIMSFGLWLALNSKEREFAKGLWRKFTSTQ